MGIALVMFLVLMVLPMIGGIMLLVMSRKRSQGFPACGKCGYDVTGTLGTPNARCPECGSDFGIVGITPAVTTRNRAALAAGIALLLIPVTCIGGSVLLSRASFSRARQATVQTRQAAVAAQAQAAAMAQQTQLASAPADPALVETFRPKAAALTQFEATERASAVLQEIAQRLKEQTLSEEIAAQLRAEYEAMNQRAMVPDAPVTQPGTARPD